MRRCPNHFCVRWERHSPSLCEAVLSVVFLGGITNGTVLFCRSLTSSALWLLVLFAGEVDFMHMH